MIIYRFGRFFISAVFGSKCRNNNLVEIYLYKLNYILILYMKLYIDIEY